MSRAYPIDHVKVFEVFATYGYQKTTMDAVGLGLGKSRQWLYNNFLSKTALFEWMVAEIVSQAISDTEQALANSSNDPIDNLIIAFDAWPGKYVPIVRRTKFGRPIIEESRNIAFSTSGSGAVLPNLIMDYLLESGLAQDKDAAQEIGYVAYLATSGLFDQAASAEDFQQGMRRILGRLTKP